MRELFDVLYQTKEQPLPVDLRASSVSKVVESFVRAEIAEHGFYGCETLAVLDLALVTVESLFHVLDKKVRFGDGFVAEERDLPSDGFVWSA